MLAKHLRFCEEYVVDLNATKAYIRAGYSVKGANQSALRLLEKAEIKAKVKELKKIRGEKTELTAQMVIDELKKIGFANMKSFTEGGNSIKDISKLDNKITAAVQTITTTVTEGDFGTKTQVKLGLASKIDALEKLGRHLGIFEKDNEQRNGVIIVDITE